MTTTPVETLTVDAERAARMAQGYTDIEAAVLVACRRAVDENPMDSRLLRDLYAAYSMAEQGRTGRLHRAACRAAAAQ